LITLKSETKNKRFSNDRNFGNQLVSDFLPFPYLAVILVLAAYSGHWISLFFIGATMLAVNLKLTADQTRHFERWPDKEIPIWFFNSRLAVNICLEVSIIVLSGNTSPGWLVVLPSLLRLLLPGKFVDL
jgi:hypothetical protein